MELISETPEKKWKMWAISIVLYLAAPLFSISYYTSMLNKGAYPPDADSIFIGIMNESYGTALLSPIYFLVIYLILRNYPGRHSILSWNKNKTILSAFFTLLFAILAIIELWNLPHVIEWKLPIEGLNIILWVWLFMLLRAIVIKKI